MVYMAFSFFLSLQHSPPLLSTAEGGKIEKQVVIFLATTDDTTTTIQREEIEEYLWLKFDKAMNSLKFPNDKQMLRKANDYLLNMEAQND